jgi:hypothetical protein
MSASPESAAVADSDAEQLRKLGYTSNFNRSMSLWENFALGFTYLSPVVGFIPCSACASPPAARRCSGLTCWSAASCWCA